MDSRIQQSVIDNLRGQPQTVEIGPFVIVWSPALSSRNFNYATPLPGAAITSADVGALVAAFRDIERTPRLEYVVSSAPELENLLVAAGFQIEGRHDYLVCTPETLVMPPPQEGFSVGEPETDEDCAVFVAMQHRAFGEEPVASEADVERLRSLMQRGGVARQILTAQGLCVAAGVAVPVGQALVAEVAGIAVAADHRRRGLAGLVTAAVTAELFTRGAEAGWLEASGEDAWRVYRRAGYAPAGKRLYIALD